MPLIISDSVPDVLTWVFQHHWFFTFLLALGSLTFVRFVVKTAVVLSQTFVLSGTSLTKFVTKQGSWAVVSGASTGIGREFAIQLGKAGFNVLLAARSVDALNETTSEIIAASKSGVENKVIAIDLSKDDQKAYELLADTCKDLDIGVLVNNAGKSHEMPTDFSDTPTQEMEEICKGSAVGLTLPAGAHMASTHSS